MIPARRWLAAREFKLQRWHLALIGLVIGFLTGIVVTTGPLSVPVFLAYGLVKGRVSRDRGRRLTRHLRRQVRSSSARSAALPWDAIAKGARHRRVADGGLVSRQALSSSSCRRNASAC